MGVGRGRVEFERGFEVREGLGVAAENRERGGPFELSLGVGRVEGDSAREMGDRLGGAPAARGG